MASGAAKRYAQALFSLAEEKGNFDAWLADLERLDSLVQDEQAARVLTSPNVSTAQKLAVLDSALAETQPEIRNLAHLLLRRQRLESVSDMVELFRASVLEAQGIAIAEITTADPLNEQEQAVVRERLSKLVQRDVQLHTKTDPAIIGGIVARIGDQLIDGSVVNQLRRLRARLVAG
jgi:F-type H+-transporting ATPase subunit delta